MTFLNTRVIAKVRTWPVIGKFVRIVGALLQLPELIDRQTVFEDQQLPSLLSAISDVNHRQLQQDVGEDSNFARSVPVALRRMAREIADLRAQNVAHNKNFDAAFSDLNTRFGKSQQELAGLETRLSEIQQELAGLAGTLDYSINRIEFVRRELMFEMRYGSTESSSGANSLRARSRIISTEKVAAARKEQLRLNLGCGHIPVDGYVNVDRRPLAGVDVVSEADELPFEKGEIDEIFSSHMLEEGSPRS